MEGIVVACVPLPRHRIGAKDRVDARQVLRTQLDVPRGVVLVEVVGVRRA